MKAPPLRHVEAGLYIDLRGLETWDSRFRPKPSMSGPMDTFLNHPGFSPWEKIGSDAASLQLKLGFCMLLLRTYKPLGAFIRGESNVGVLSHSELKLYILVTRGVAGDFPLGNSY